MELEYDRKFEEMKMYIPFLENMIKRLETTNSGVSNPRKAQLDKIRSLRDLLLDKKKRMKMENLLKCEQVLINLYAKVEQRDSLSETNKKKAEPTQKDKSDLSLVRNKLKSVASKLHDETPDTLPEIAKPINTEVDCTPGSKEPALFQRRPTKVSLPPSESPSKRSDDNSSINKRHYTRVLMSPEPKTSEWSASEETDKEKPLFSRRSPKRSPRRYSPSYKRERKKSSKQRSKSSQQTKDLNITLNVPEESLNSLNTKDILSRIINCSDNDVDIDTLRGLRSQILGELKQTGAKDDISDLILKSYKKKGKRSKKRDEVEEGEISDSESEAIENIYGSLVVVNKDKESSNSSKISSDKQQPRKIQICLVINSDKENDKTASDQKLDATLDATEFEAYTGETGETTNVGKISEKVQDKSIHEKTKAAKNEKEKNKHTSEKKNYEQENKKHEGNKNKCADEKCNPNESKAEDSRSTNNQTHSTSQEKPDLISSECRQANFYQPLKEKKSKSEELFGKEVSSKPSDENIDDSSDNVTKIIEIARNIQTAKSSVKKSVKKNVVSEIDILQALKKEILGETVTVPISKATTPPLHLPKVTKVTSALETSKKRISIENYKQKSVPSLQHTRFTAEKCHGSSKDDISKKQSLKLTEKECERFNVPPTLPSGDSSDDEERSSISADEIYRNLAPKSPDHDDFADAGIKPPVIIPSDPVSKVVTISKGDIDMRTVMSTGSPVSIGGFSKIMSPPLLSKENVNDITNCEKSNTNEKIRNSVSDLRMRKESNQCTVNNSSNSYLKNTERQPRPRKNYQTVAPNITNQPPSITKTIPPLMSLNVAPCMTPNLSPSIAPSINSLMTPIMNPNMAPLCMNNGMTPNLPPGLNPNMTPSRNPGMIPGVNPVMTPILTPNARSYEMTPRQNFDNDDYTHQKHVYAPIFPTFEPRDPQENEIHNTQLPYSNNSVWDDRNTHKMQREMDYQRLRNDRYQREAYNRLDSPQMRMDCPATPNPSFGRIEPPMTPVHSFGRSDCPMTPTHPFGRSEPNMTQTNMFGRNDYHHNSSISSHKYNKSYDPRLNRGSDYDNYLGRSDERNRGYFKENRSSDNNYKYRRSGQDTPGRESSVGRSLSREYDTDGSRKNDYRHQKEKSKSFDDFNRRRNYRARSIGRMNPSEDSYSSPVERGRPFVREPSMDKSISVLSHTGRSFNIDTSFKRTFQDIKSSSVNMSFDVRRQRAASVGRTLREYPREDIKRLPPTNTKFKLDRRSPDRRSPDRRSPDRRSPDRRSPDRRSPDRRSPDRRSPDRSKALGFRRACSVGRELKDYNSERNFKDIKADLRSCTFNSFEKKLQSRDDRGKSRDRNTNVKSKPVETKSNRESRSRLRDCDTVNDRKNYDSFKYSPRKNYRDPRLRREINEEGITKDKYKVKDRNQGNSRDKTYGIVYSNDNIAKGTILASAAGVRNFKIPKIKRPDQEYDGSKGESKSESKREILTKKDVKVIDTDNVKVKRIESKGNKTEKTVTNKPMDINKDQSSSKLEKTKLQNTALLSNNKDNDTSEEEDKSINIDKDWTTVESEKSKLQKASLLSKNEDKKDSEEDDSDGMNAISEVCERRITRSAKKVLTHSRIRNKERPLQRLRRIRKPLLYDSDSDSQNSIKNIEKEKKDKVETTNMELNEIEDKQNDDAEADKIIMKENTAGARKDESTGSPKSFSTSQEKNKIVNNPELKPAPALKNVLCDEQNDSLDINFGDDMFSDNIASGSVLDNINALIADLDNGIEAPKINDINDKFIKNIVGSISSNDSPIPIEVNERDFASDIMIGEKLGFTDVSQDGEELTGDKNEKTEMVQVSETRNDIGNVNEFVQLENKLDVLSGAVGKKSDTHEVLPTTLPENSQEPDMLATSDDITREFSEILNTFNNDAIVSTTASDGKPDEVLKELKVAGTIKDATSYFVPDSTNNSSEASTIESKDFERNVPDSTNESVDMNSDITSTHNPADMLSKEQSVATSSCSDNLPRIDSIGKLLSILEDKNKIKELITLLGKDSTENEKLKKKLEKLSEIVSDDREKTQEDINKHNTEVVSPTNEVQKSDENGSESSEPTSSKNQFDFGNEVPDNKSDEVHLQNSTEQEPPKIDKAVNSELNKTENEVQNEYNPNEQHVENENVVKQESQENSNVGFGEHVAANSNVENKANEAIQNVIEASSVHEIPEDIEKVNNKESMRIKLPSVPLKQRKKNVKKSKFTKKGKSKLAKNLQQNKIKRTTTLEAGNVQAKLPVPRKPSRELLKLHEDIREMSISEDIFNATSIRRCRLAKMVDDKSSKVDTQSSEAEPIVVLEKIKGKDVSDETTNPIERISNKRIAKVKYNVPKEELAEIKNKEKTKYKPGPKSKCNRQEDDPYVFETDSVVNSNITVDSKDQNTDSDSGDSLKSFGSSELLVDLKKKVKRKKRTWKLGVIKTKAAKKKKDLKNAESTIPDESTTPDECTQEPVSAVENKMPVVKIPNLNCFTDKMYCFNKNISVYSCCLCEYIGKDIVIHYKKHHPHSEIPLSRLNTVTAEEAIKQCEVMNLQAVSKLKTLKYVCRFCFKEFTKTNTALERFFWHVVSEHTGEYKQDCAECVNASKCPFNLYIPPPPKSLYGQLIGYICGRCNFTQVSLENLKTHVIIRHDDEQTEVFCINLAEIPRKVLQSLLAKSRETCTETPRVLRSTRSNQNLTDLNDDYSDFNDSVERYSHDKSIEGNNSFATSKRAAKNKIQSKFTFENDDMSDTSSYSKNDEIIKAGIKLERDDDSQDSHCDDVLDNFTEPSDIVKADGHTETTSSNDVFVYPHFKIRMSDSGTKEYMCCINGVDNHYRTTLLISLKKHVQMKHSENWDGYCFVCKVIVTSQGRHMFKDCLQHFLDKHMDNFPIMGNADESTINNSVKTEPSTSVKNAPGPSYINVRPLFELISPVGSTHTSEKSSSLPKIHSVVSLGTEGDAGELCKYEEAQAEIMSKKHRVVLETMLWPEKLIQVFKCAGRFCSYTTDNVEEALVHASTHQKIGGENSLNCAYCNFNTKGNAIDLVTHVFKRYSQCPYACGKCFYRASVSQLVYAHVKRVHANLNADEVAVLYTGTTVQDDTKDDMLPRDQAVLHYVCKNRDAETGADCQFKSFILTKFREHLQTKHEKDVEYTCYICDTSVSSPKLLSHHLKCHGLRIYQCCRCLFGADNETELLAHASEKHPLKQPKAYLRIITHKGPNSEVRVLPLAVFSKNTVKTTEVPACTAKENPVKQAERSMDLENLISHTISMIESPSTITKATAESATLNNDDTQSDNREATCVNALLDGDKKPSAIIIPVNNQNETNDIVTTIKSELKDKTESGAEQKTNELPVPSKIEVVCLDSDDDNSRQNVIDLSNDQSPEDTSTLESDTSKEVKDVVKNNVPRTCLYKCSKCLYVNKTEATFKRHLLICYPETDENIACAHCSHSGHWNEIVNHYTTTHLGVFRRYACSDCGTNFAIKTSAKNHMKRIHSINSPLTVVADSAQSLTHCIIDLLGPIQRQPYKRKLSIDGASKSVGPPAPKLKKYGPHDVDRLPINPILDDLVYCALCEFSTKVRLNMVRHLQLHAEQQPVPRTAPVNPVPHLDTNEKHFDKMVNLASSSVTSKSDKVNKEGTSTTAEHLSPEAAAIYPKYVTPRHRYTCGAKDCSYISVNESMFKFHWETLHQGTNDYHCVHCPPHQHLDTSRPLTAARIIAHLKMHDVKLYGCSSCTFYHHARKIIEKHLREVHSGKLVIVREDGFPLPSVSPAPVQPVASAPTMDLKAWQCGLCKFKSMLRPEVIEHCGKYHQSKMQFKCTYCGFRTSNIENISKHQVKQHPTKKEEVFYFYYREGSIPDEPDGVARWQKQSQKSETEVKTDTQMPTQGNAMQTSKPAPPKLAVNLDIVKKEVLEPEMDVQVVEPMDELCKKFGKFCEPNGLRYKCPLCKIVIEDSQIAMQSHLYEELQYRKWGCAVCSYKAFHKPGLQQHVETEHGHSRDAREPIELQLDPRIETWVSKLLEHQTAIIVRNKENLAKQKVEILRTNPGPSSAKVTEKPAEPPEPAKTESDKPNVSMAELERLFGAFGVPSNMAYSCPKCNTTVKSETVMQEHLESELTKIRWCCNNCNVTFQTYHEAQFHCRSTHQGQSARPVEATRDASLRAAWVAAVLRIQKLSMNYMPVTETKAPEPTIPTSESSADNSLLVVRYEEKVSMPEEEIRYNKKSDSDDDRLVIDEPERKPRARTLEPVKCPFCDVKFKYLRFLDAHVLKHFGLKPYTCPYCSYSDLKKPMENHLRLQHPDKSLLLQATPLPPLANTKDDTEIVCLVCEKSMSKAEGRGHFHDKMRPEFGNMGDVVYKCCICLTLHKTVADMKVHHKTNHATNVTNHASYKLQNVDRLIGCDACNMTFPILAEFRNHCETKHGLRTHTALTGTITPITIDCEESGNKRKADDEIAMPVPKRVAKKSTTKLPTLVAVAKKSTTKLPFGDTLDSEEYSYYGTKPSISNLENVTTLMPFCNTMVPFSLKKLSEIIKIDPSVMVEDISKKTMSE